MKKAKRILCLLLLVLFFCMSVPASLYAASHTLEYKNGATLVISYQKMRKENEFLGLIFTFKTDKDVKVDLQYNGSFRLVDKHGEVSVEDNEVFLLYDANGNEFRRVSDGVYIGGKRTYEREIIANVPTQVIVWFKVGKNYKPTKSYPRANINVSGANLEFRDLTPGF